MDAEALMDMVLDNIAKITDACRVIAEQIEKQRETEKAMGMSVKPEHRVPGLRP